MLEIIEVEGPILGSRLYQLYVRSAGQSAVGSTIRSTLNSIMHGLERSNKVIADDPLGSSGQYPKTYRLPHQPPIHVRELGGRTLHEVPPLELAARIRALQQPRDTAEDTYRRVLSDNGLKALTSKTRGRLDECAELLRD